MANEKMRVVGELSYDGSYSIGKSDSGNYVFRGLYSLRPVAIKRMQKKIGKDESAAQLREVELMKKADNHPNILRIIHTEMNDDFL